MRLFITVVFVGILSASFSAFAQSSQGVFKVVKGDVTVTTKEGATSKAKIGMKVNPGEKIKAGADSRAKIVMVDNNELNVSPDSEIVIESYEFQPNDNKKNVLINVLYGKVRAKVAQKYEGDNKFQVKTKSAVAGVRGTDFFTSYSPTTNATKVVTFEGHVQFGLPGVNGAILNPVFVNPGQTTSVVGSAPPPPPVEVPKSEMASMDKQTNATGEASASGPREPAANAPAADKKEDAKKGDAPGAEAPSADAPKADAPKGDAPKGDTAANGPAASGDRAPASVGPAAAGAPASPGAAPKPGSMIISSDMPSAGGIVQPVVAPPLPPAIPKIPNLPAGDLCPTCKDVTGQLQKTRIRINK